MRTREMCNCSFRILTIYYTVIIVIIAISVLGPSQYSSLWKWLAILKEIPVTRDPLFLLQMAGVYLLLHNGHGGRLRHFLHE